MLYNAIMYGLINSPALVRIIYSVFLVFLALKIKLKIANSSAAILACRPVFV